MQALWQGVIGKLEGKLSPNDMACWVAAIQPREMKDETVWAEVPSRTHLEQVRCRVSAEITRALEEAVGGPVKLMLTVGSATSARCPDATPGMARRFSPDYTFDRFVTGDSNLLAFRSAREVADRPGELHNPLFLCGGVGLGKTHLATAIAGAVWRVNPRRRVVILSAEAFANELIQAFRTNGAEAFRARFRRADVLVVDDVQFFAGKERMQEEFFHTFNALYAERRQIVLASDQPPRDIPNLEERLRGRFESGLITDIHQPDLTLRLAILAQKAKWIGLELPAEVAQLVALKMVSSVRELEGALHRLAAASALARQRLDLQFALQILRPVLRSTPPRTVEQVQRVVAERFRVSEQDLVCRQRASRVLLPRQVAMYLARKKTAATYAEIAEGFGGRNHTTVIHAVRAIERRRAASPEFAALLDNLETRLQTA